MPTRGSRIVEESGFRVTLDSQNSFRFAEFEPYRKLCGLHLKEMDVGWWDNSSNRVVFLELKSDGVWDAFDSSRDNAHDHLVTNLRKKATDVLLLLAAAWVGTKPGEELKNLLPGNVQKYPGDGKLKLIFLVDTPASRRPLLLMVKDELNRKVAGRARLFGVQHLSVVDFEAAEKMNLPVTRTP